MRVALVAVLSYVLVSLTWPAAACETLPKWPTYFPFGSSDCRAVTWTIAVQWSEPPVPGTFHFWVRRHNGPPLVLWWSIDGALP